MAELKAFDLPWTTRVRDVVRAHHEVVTDGLSPVLSGPHIYVQLQLSVKLMKLSQTSLQELAVSTTILSEPFHYWKMPAMVTLAVLDFVRAPSETMKPYLAATLAATYELWMLAEKDVGKRRAQWCEAFTILSTGEDAPVRADLVRRARSALSNEAFGDAVVDHYGEKKAERIIRACSLLLGLAVRAKVQFVFAIS